jgi:IS5 family transposase
MRHPFRVQSTLNGPPVDEIELPLNSRHTIYPLLFSLQEIYKHHLHLTHKLCEDVSQGKNLKKGAPGMSGWQILVLIVIRCQGNYSFDDMEIMFNNDRLIRQFLELDYYDETTTFHTDTLQQTFKKIRTESLQMISDAFLNLAMKDMGEDGKTVRSDSFVCQTSTHYPTDQSLLYDALRVILREFKKSIGPKLGWRQAEHLTRQAKKFSKDVSDLKKGKSKKGKAATKARKVRQAYNRLLNLSALVMQKGIDTAESEEWTMLDQGRRDQLEDYLDRLDMIITQTFNRIVLKEKVKVSDKLYSFFETHATLINRGKFPQPFEIGRRVVVSEGKTGLILDARVMDRCEVDAQETIPLLKRLSEKYGKLSCLSVDRGYRSKDLENNFEDYAEEIVIPQWGRAPKDTKETLDHREKRWWRSGVESLISALQRKNGLKRCPDKGLEAMRLWVAGGVFSRNLITYGRFLMKNKFKEEETIPIAA